MNVSIRDLKVPAISLIGAITTGFAIYAYLHSNFAEAAGVEKSFSELQHEIQQGRLQEAINNDRLWIEILEQKVASTGDQVNKDHILRQINRLDQQIDTNMGKIK